MKKECEELFIELVSPYLTALEASKGYRRDDWHGVFAFALALGAELEELEGVSESSKELIKGRLKELQPKISQLADIAAQQASEVIHNREPKAGLSNEAMEVLGEIQGKLREIVIDNVCACEAGRGITMYEVGRFPQQDRILQTFRDVSGGYRITKVHDDGGLTFEARGTSYIIDTDGNLFPQQQPEQKI